MLAPILVHVMLHLPLHGGAVAQLERELRRHGRVTVHAGSGTWTGGGDPRAPIQSEPVDHVELLMDARAATALLPGFLHRQRLLQHQHETLGELFCACGPPAHAWTRIIVRVPAQTPAARLAHLHRIFANRGHGGDSAYREGSGLVDYSGVPPAQAPRIERELARAAFTYTTAPDTFYTDDEERTHP